MLPPRPNLEREIHHADAPNERRPRDAARNPRSWRTEPRSSPAEPLRSVATEPAQTHTTSERHARDAARIELARRAATGERAAQRALFHELRRPMHATLYRVLGSNRHLEDLLQEAFIELFRSLPSYRGDAKLTTWADSITARVAFRHLRRGRLLLVAAPLASVPSEAATPDREVHAKLGIERLYAAMDEMHPNYRIAFALFWIDGRTIEEVAEVTGVSAIAAKSRIWRARRWLKNRAKGDRVLAGWLEE